MIEQQPQYIWISSLDMCWDHFEKMCEIHLKCYWQSHLGHMLWLHSRCDPNVPSSPISGTCYGYIPNVIKLCLVGTSEANWSSAFNVPKMFPLVPGALAPSVIKVVCAQLRHTFVSIVFVIWPTYDPHRTPYSWPRLFMTSFIRLCILFPMTHMHSF